MSVLIISNSLDVHSDVVGSALINAGEAIVRLDTDHFFEDGAELSFFSPHGGKITLKGEDVQLSEIRSVLYRRPEPIKINVADAGQRKFADRELKEFLEHLYFGLGDAFWVSKLTALTQSRHKGLQLNLARSVGLKTPRTIITNSPREVERFFGFCKGRVIYKTLRFPTIEPGSGDAVWGVPTTVVTQKEMHDINLIRNSGGIFQEYVEKSFEVRVTVVGDAVFSAKIDSQSDEASKIDWRDGVVFGRVPVTSYALPRDIEDKCLEIVRKFDLHFGAIDLICTPEGEYVFLEINPNGQWLWVEELTHQPILQTMVRLLSKRA